MIKHKEFVDAVASHAGIGGTPRTLAAICGGDQHAGPPLAARAAATLGRAASRTGSVENAADVPGQTERIEGTEVITEVAHRLDATPEQARYLTQAVLAGLRDNAPELTDQLSQHLDSDMRRCSLRGASRPGSGDRHGISRTVTLPEDRLGPLVDRVQREAHERNDHAHTIRQRDGVTG